MSRANVEKAKRGEKLSSSEVTSAATVSSVATTEQGRPRDLHSIAADLGRALGVTIKIEQ